MNKLAKSLILIGISFLIISFIILTNNSYLNYRANKISKEVIEEINNKNNEPKNDDKNIVNTMNNYYSDIKTIEIDGESYIGTIKIPVLNLELPIIESFNYDNLKKAPCRYYGSVFTNDLIICGHSYKAHFKYISNLKQKDLIIITDLNNEIYFYEVLEVEILEADDIEKMFNSEFDLTIYTCTLDSMKRVTVRCNRVYE